MGVKDWIDQLRDAKRARTGDDATMARTAEPTSEAPHTERAADPADTAPAPAERVAGESAVDEAAANAPTAVLPVCEAPPAADDAPSTKAPTAESTATLGIPPRRETRRPAATPPPREPAPPARIDGPQRVVAVLVPVEGELLGRVFALRDGHNSLGRAEANDVMLPSMKISRRHAEISARDGCFTLRPVADHNPVLIDERPVHGPARLNDGAKVRIGRTLFRFRIIGDAQ